MRSPPAISASIPAVHGVHRVRAGVARGLDVQGEQPAARVEAGPHRIVMVARVSRGLHSLAPLLDPLHRPVEPHGQRTQRDVLGIQDGLDAEATADVGCDDADAILGQAENAGQQMTREMGHLRRRPQRQLAVRRTPVGDPAAALHRCGALAIGPECPLDDGRRGGQRGLHIALLEAARRTRCRDGLVHERRVLARGGEEIDRGGQRLVVHAHQGRGVLDTVAIGTRHDRHGLAGEAHDRPRQDGLLGLDVARQRRARADAQIGQARVLSRQHCEHAGMGGGRRDVDCAQACVRVSAAHEGHVQ